MDDLHQDIGFEAYPVARLVAGRDMSETPAVKGAKRGDIKCDVNVNSLAYWNDPQGERDQNFKSPFAIEEVSRSVETLHFFVCFVFRHGNKLTLFSCRVRPNTFHLLQTEAVGTTFVCRWKSFL